jgi:hypothetical protein
LKIRGLWWLSPMVITGPGKLTNLIRPVVFVCFDLFLIFFCLVLFLFLFSFAIVWFCFVLLFVFVFARSTILQINSWIITDHNCCYTVCWIFN